MHWWCCASLLSARTAASTQRPGSQTCRFSPTPLQDAIERGWLRAAGPHLPAVLHTALEVARGLGALHAAGVVHGDVSAYNVMLACEGCEALAGGRGFVAKVRRAAAGPWPQSAAPCAGCLPAAAARLSTLPARLPRP